MCDFRKQDSDHFNSFIQAFIKMLSLDTQNKEINTFHNCLKFAMDKIDFSKDVFNDIDNRFLVIWLIKKHIFPIKKWKFKHTCQSFQNKCENSIVTKCDMKSKRI
jgi:hypothetical protein